MAKVTRFEPPDVHASTVAIAVAEGWQQVPSLGAGLRGAIEALQALRGASSEPVVVYYERQARR